MGATVQNGIVEKAKRARMASVELANVATGAKNRALLRIADSIDAKREQILEANARDVKEAEQAVRDGTLSKPLLDRLKLDDAKIQEMINSVRDVAKLDDPVGKTLSAIELDTGLELFQVSCPIGVIGAIFESRPDVLVQISSLCLKTGNAVLLKGGSEAWNSNVALFHVVEEAAAEGGEIPAGWIQLLETREDVKEMLKLNEYIDLLVPRGSGQFVKYIQDNTSIMVLGHSEGICHVYVDRDADLDMALDICYDAKVQYPAVCNAMETLLVDTAIADAFLPRIAAKYRDAGVEMRVCPETMRILAADADDIDLKPATEEDWYTEYNDLIISIRVVSGVDDAIDHINRYGSGHTDAIVTSNNDTALKFLRFVDSSSVMHNASTRFSDGYRYGKGAEVGISTYKVHARGPVGPEGLVIYKYMLLGNGHVVAPYVGADAKQFTHRRLSKQFYIPEHR